LLALLGRVFHHFYLLRPVSGQAAWQAMLRLPRLIALVPAIRLPGEASTVQRWVHALPLTLQCPHAFE
ncbi:MAG: hypothetical protein IRA32_14965, partial [Xanthomonas citri pv. citri]